MSVKTRRGCHIPWNWSCTDCKLPWRFWEPSLGLSQEQVFLASDLSRHSQHGILFLFFGLKPIFRDWRVVSVGKVSFVGLRTSGQFSSNHINSWACTSVSQLWGERMIGRNGQVAGSSWLTSLMKLVCTYKFICTPASLRVKQTNRQKFITVWTWLLATGHCTTCVLVFWSGVDWYTPPTSPGPSHLVCDL